MGVAIRDFLKARRDRALGTIMGFIEREMWDRLNQAERAALRAQVISALDSYHDSVLDLVKSDAGVRNEELLSLLERVDRHLSRP
jgi:hypothetical protein